MMTQLVHTCSDPGPGDLILPDPDSRIKTGLTWGHTEQPFTPAFWAAQTHFWLRECRSESCFRLGDTLCEEAAACLLGGHGIPAEVGLAAFERLRDQGLLDGNRHTASMILAALQRPLQVGDRQVRYRFARQKSRYLASLLQALKGCPESASDRQLRDWFISCPGIGPKTASWIVRNWRSSDEVAIIDVHLHRAGLLTGFFTLEDRLPKDYGAMEDRFLIFASAIGVRASVLDAVIWQQMRRSGKLPVRMLDEAASAWRCHHAA